MRGLSCISVYAFITITFMGCVVEADIRFVHGLSINETFDYLDDRELLLVKIEGHTYHTASYLDNSGKKPIGIKLNSAPGNEKEALTSIYKVEFDRKKAFLGNKFDEQLQKNNDNSEFLRRAYKANGTQIASYSDSLEVKSRQRELRVGEELEVALRNSLTRYNEIGLEGYMNGKEVSSITIRYSLGNGPERRSDNTIRNRYSWR